jgi:hypothetical protein
VLYLHSGKPTASGLDPTSSFRHRLRVRPAIQENLLDDSLSGSGDGNLNRDLSLSIPRAFGLLSNDFRQVFDIP